MTKYMISLILSRRRLIQKNQISHCFRCMEAEGVWQCFVPMLEPSLQKGIDPFWWTFLVWIHVLRQWNKFWIKNAAITNLRRPFMLVDHWVGLGAYTGFHTLATIGDRFGGAVLLDCGQNVGPGCSLKARAGIWFLRKLSGSMNNRAMMG